MQVLAVAMPYYFSYTKSSRAAQSEQEEQCLCGDLRQHNSYKFSFLRKQQMYFLFGLASLGLPGGSTRHLMDHECQILVAHHSA